MRWRFARPEELGRHCSCERLQVSDARICRSRLLMLSQVQVPCFSFLTKEVHMRRFMIVALAFLFVLVGMQQIAQADEVKAAVEDAKGKANANAEKAKGEAKALTEEAQGNKVQGEMERAKGQTKAAGERIKGEAKELKAKTE